MDETDGDDLVDHITRERNDWEQQRQNLMVGEYKDPIVSLRKVVKRTAAAIRLQCWFRELRNKKKSWVQVLKNGLSNGFRNPKQEAELARLHFEWKARKERLEAFKRIWKIHAREEQEQRAREMKRAKRMDRDEHWLKCMRWEGEQVRQDIRRGRLYDLRTWKKELQQRMQNIANHSDYWHGSHDARLNSIINTEYKTMWEGMEKQKEELDNQIFDQECEW